MCWAREVLGDFLGLSGVSGFEGARDEEGGGVGFRF